ncbi:MAG: citrate transporter, partial [Clostridia bacterium]|nr:citrate transporter [Clostridia bacterium]
LENAVGGREVETGILASQVISNVPAALLLSKFTTDGTGLLVGVNLGGLGTLIASMASLITYRLYAATDRAMKGRYFGEFTLWNVVFLAALYALTLV